MDDDHVSLGEVARRWAGPKGFAFREVEVELAPETPEGALEEIVERLESAGATGAIPVPKGSREQLGPAAQEPPSFEAGPVHATSTLGEVVAAFIGESVSALLLFDPALRLGGDPENLHQTRVAVRRLRSLLRTFRPVLDGTWLEGIEPNLRSAAATSASPRGDDRRGAGRPVGRRRRAAPQRVGRCMEEGRPEEAPGLAEGKPRRRPQPDEVIPAPVTRLGSEAP